MATKGKELESDSDTFRDESQESFDENTVTTSFVPESEKSSFLAFLKKAMGGIDLSRITAPPFILAPFSVLETNADLMAHPDYFCEIAQKDTPLERFVAYVRWYIARYHKQSTTGSGKKPYNPILGERFICTWEDKGFGNVKLTSEQVSHHPPILAEYYENETAGICNIGHFGLKSHFSGTIVKASVQASNWTHLPFLNEDYLCTFPNFVIRGFLVANPFFDVLGEVALECPTTSYKAVLEYKDKPWFRGEYHQIVGRIFHKDQPDYNIYTISGNWKKQVFLTETSTGTKTILFDSGSKMFDRIVAPLDQQDEMESQKVWKDVTSALKTYNYREAGDAKNKIEEKQREEKKKRDETGENFELKYFYYDEESERWLLNDYDKRFKEIKANNKNPHPNQVKQQPNNKGKKK